MHPIRLSPHAGLRLGRLARVVLPAVCVLVFAGALSRPAHADAIDDYNVAYAFYREHQWAHAEEAFRKFISSHPEHERTAAARLYLGLCLVQERKFGPARDVFRGFVDKHATHPDLALAMYRIGECSYFLGDSPAAKVELDRFLSRFPKNDLGQWALQYLADTHLRLKDPRSALATLKLQLDRYPQGELADDARLLIARTHAAQGDRPAAQAALEQLAASETSLRAADAQVELGMLHYEQQRFAEARTAFDAVRTRFPQSPLAAVADLNGGYASYHLGEYDAAIERFDRAAQSPQQAGEAQFWKGMSLKSRGDAAEAATVLTALAKSAAGTPLEERAQFHAADALLRSGDHADATAQFLAIVDRRPQSPLAPDALHLATEAALLGGSLDEAERLHQRFEQAFREHGLWLLQRLLHGRIRLARGDRAFDAGKQQEASDAYEAAAAEFAAVADESQVPRTSHLARLLLARTRDRQERYADVVAALAPVVEALNQPQAEADFAEALTLTARALLKLDRNAEAAAAARQFVERFPNQERVGEALASLALAEARLKHAQEVDAALDGLWRNELTRDLARRTTYQLAETAYTQESWDRAAALFQRLVEGGGGDLQTSALSGLGYARHKGGQYASAAEAFERLQSAPNVGRELAADAAQMRGLSLRLAGQLQPAADAYAAALRQFALPADARELSPEDVRVGWAVFQSARGLARLRAEQQQVAPADEAYAQAVEQLQRLPEERRKELDQLLQEWALFHYQAQRYDQADVVWRKLQELLPGSPLADDAALYLGESLFFAGKLDDARQAFTQLAESAQADGFVRQRAYSLLLDIEAERQDWAALVAAAEDFLQRFPQSDQRFYARYRQGEALLRAGDPEGAVQRLGPLETSPEALVQQADWFPSLRLLLAEAHLQAREYEQVETVVQRFRADNPDSPLLYQADEILGRRYKNQARWKEAREALQRVVDSKSGFRTETAAKAQLLIAETYLLEDKYTEAVTEYYKVYLNYSFPDYQAPALYQAGQCDERLNRWEGAVKSYETLIEKFPEHEFARKAGPALEQARQKLMMSSLTPSPETSN